MKWALALVLLVGCTESNVVMCTDGRACPTDTVCDDTHDLCVSDEQSKVCAGKADGDECTAGLVDGHCLDAICLPSVCGDHVVELGEMCDDGNTDEEDPVSSPRCSADCTSTRVCGNGVTDAVRQEECDDGNKLEHDGCSSECLTERPHWVERTLPPLPRAAAGYAYDSKRGRLVVFGGRTDNSELLGETLEWTGADWLKVDTQGPPPRDTTAMAYDSGRGEIVMFGGFDGTNDLTDTWVYDGSTWTLRNVGGPKERYGEMLVYDPKRHVTVLFGGWNDFFVFPAIGMLDDTWEWDGTTWTEITPLVKPPRRQFPAAAFDPVRGVIVMTGGDNQNDGVLADTWTYDGQWHDVTNGPNPQVRSAGLAWDPVGRRMLLAAGFNNSLAPQQTYWTWDGTSWTNRGAGPYSARAALVMANTGSQIVMFGGYTGGITTSSETWLYTSMWTQPQNPGARQAMVGINDVVDARAIFYGGRNASNTLQTDTWALSATGFQQIAVTQPTGRTDHAMAWDAVHNMALLYGGFDSAVNGETWTGTFTPTGAMLSWSFQNVAPTPGPLRGAAAAFDGSRVILHGGKRSDGTLSADTWAWDGTSWSKLAGTGPTARTGAAMAYDPVHKNVVLFAGFCADPLANNGVVSCNDTWIFDGTAWTQAMTPFRPVRRSDATLTYNAARKHLILAGGTTEALDAYEWDGTQWLPIPATNVPAGRQGHAAVTSIDGAGIVISGNFLATAERWELRWDATERQDRCDGSDADQDSLVGCADPDCWTVCTPLCPPGVACNPMAGPRCGDGTCQSPRESCRSCPADCMACTAVCGDYVCDPGEASCPGDCP